MGTFATFVLGLLVGWIIEWVIDWIYWRRRTREQHDENSRLRAQLAVAEDRKMDLEHQTAVEVPVSTAALQDENDRQRGQLTQAEERIKDLERQLGNRMPVEIGGSQDENNRLRGQLAQAEERIKALESQQVAQVPTPTGMQERSAGLVSGADTATMPSVTLPTEKDDLIVIDGIGPVIAGKLGQAGIHTFEQLGQLTPDQLRSIVGDSISRLADEDDIIAQANQLAAQKRGRG
jgi:predicted flap endonuclease-1-like 5' DNA nuclease